MLKIKINRETDKCRIMARGTVDDIAAELLVAIHKIYGALGEPHKEDFRETIESGMENGRVFDTRGGTDHA